MLLFFFENIFLYGQNPDLPTAKAQLTIKFCAPDSKVPCAIDYTTFVVSGKVGTL